MLVFNTESPMVVVLSGSMEPSMYRGDILVLIRRPDIEIGDVIVY
jgi:signal peptidase